MSNQLKQTLVAGAAVPVPGAKERAPAASQPEAFAEGSGIQRIAEEFDSLTAAMLPESLDEAESDDWSEPDLTGLDGNIVLCDLSGDGAEAVAEPADNDNVAAGAKRPLTMGVPKFDQEPELELELDVDRPAQPPPLHATAVGRPAPPLPAPADLAARGSAAHGAAVPPPVPVARDARPAAPGRGQRAALAATVPAGSAVRTATPPPIPGAHSSASFSTEFSRGGASVHTFPIVRASFILAGLAAVCAVAWFFVLSP